MAAACLHHDGRIKTALRLTMVLAAVPGVDGQAWMLSGGFPMLICNFPGFGYLRKGEGGGGGGKQQELQEHDTLPKLLQLFVTIHVGKDE